MRKATAILLLTTVFLLVFPTIICADTGSLDQEVPFGMTQSKNGQYIPVFENTTQSTKIGLLLPNQLCALDSTILQGKNRWYHIIYMDDNGEPQAGYVKESNFHPLTLSEYTELLTDPETKQLAEQYLALSETGLLFTSAQADISPKQAYVLNTNTKKFHYPYCKSADKIKPKNRIDYTGTREEIISMGYVPCKNCNP